MLLLLLAGVYAPDKAGSLFKSGQDTTAWAINSVRSRLNLAMTRLGCILNIIKGLTGLMYYGALNTFFPMHTEDGDFFSVNVLHYGAPKVWFFVAKKDLLRVRNLIRKACRGTIS